MDISYVLIRCSKNLELLPKVCKIKKYLETNEKFNFFDELNNMLSQESNKKYFGYISFVYFHLLIIKYYTDIEVELNFECFDKLYSNGIIDYISGYIGKDYQLLLKFIVDK